MKNKKRESGFTLIELMVVIAIIAFIVATVMLVLSQARQKSRNSKRVADIKQIVSALDLYNLNCGNYPINTTAITLNTTLALYTGGSGCSGGGFGLKASASGTILISEMESAPLPLDGSCTDTQGLPTGNQYTYSSNATGSTFTLSFCLGQTTGGYPAGFNSITR